MKEDNPLTQFADILQRSAERDRERRLNFWDDLPETRKSLLHIFGEDAPTMMKLHGPMALLNSAAISLFLAGPVACQGYHAKIIRQQLQNLTAGGGWLRETPLPTTETER